MSDEAVNATPFRDLFVELPRQLFEALKGIGEQAVVQAQRPAGKLAARTGTSTIDVLRMMANALQERYGWSEAEAGFVVDRDSYALHVRLRCGHGKRVEIPAERILTVSPRDVCDAILDVCDEQEYQRRCFCVQRETQP